MLPSEHSIPDDALLRAGAWRSFRRIPAYDDFYLYRLQIELVVNGLQQRQRLFAG